jgi:hypothetical protein
VLGVPDWPLHVLLWQVIVLYVRFWQVLCSFSVIMHPLRGWEERFLCRAGRLYRLHAWQDCCLDWDGLLQQLPYWEIWNKCTSSHRLH